MGLRLATAVWLLALLPVIYGDCDSLSLHYYKELGCSPVYTTSRTCPSRFDCGGLAENRRNFCVMKRQVLGDGGEIKFGSGISNPCVSDCICRENYNQSVTRFRWLCTDIDCPQYFHSRPQQGCYWKQELTTCCPVKKVCKNDLATCVYNGIQYKENDRFHTFSGSSCYKCICLPSFNGTISYPWCTEIGCDLEILAGDQLARGCAPVYSKSFCCPIDWRCPDPEDTVKKAPISVNSTTSGQCKFGKLSLNVGDKVLPDLEGDCQCNIPPYVVCTSSF